MIKRILVIRCTNLQHLDKVFQRLRAEFPGAATALLTHRHGALQAADYTETVIVYPYTENYGFYRGYKPLNDMNFDAVVVPVGNVSGSGFLNVFLFSLTIKTGQRLMCNLPLELKPISKVKIIAMAIRNGLYTAIGGVLTAAAAAVFVVGWPLFAMLTRPGRPKQ
ncbi:MAG: hypothetical protein L7F77_07890 [Candidatus Magnetominusculus sp. LBB02]|nr:hypothetical protein [Candidatus Magnetominusculus sp. LBB02]